MDLDIKKLKKELTNIYTAIFEQEVNEKLKKEAARIYGSYKEAAPLLNSALSHALNSLVDIAFETGIKVTKNQAEKILKAMKKEV